MKVEIFQSIKTHEWFFCVRARNGQIVCQSEGYKRQRDCRNALVRILEEADTLLAQLSHPPEPDPT